MGKDPAFLFYHQDFFSGVSDLNNDQVGAYIRCLCIQASKGGIKEQHMKNICNSHECFEAVREKFKIDEITNLLYNERLKNEIIKRQNYSESRRNNRLKSKDINNISKTYVKHMEDENENEIENRIVNENKTKIKKALIPNFDEFLEYAKTKEPNVDSSDLKLKYDSWLESDWSINRSGKYQKIVYWKSTLLNTLPYIKKLTVSSGPQKAQRNQYL